MIEKAVLLMMVAFALLAVREDRLRTAVIYLGSFSLVGSFTYLLHGAPDVAIAEAIIGSTLSTFLILVALKKHRIFTVYYSMKKGTQLAGAFVKSRDEFVDLTEKFCISKELEPHIVYTTEKLDKIERSHQYDLIVIHGDDDISIYGSRSSYQFGSFEAYLNESWDQDILLIFIKE